MTHFRRLAYVAAILSYLVALAGCQASRSPRCAWTTVNHSGVEECHLAGPLPDPPAAFMAVDTTSHLEL